MTKPRKTENPYKGSPRVVQRATWADGYKCGHSDAEMDARDNVVNMTDQYTLGLTNEIDRLKQLNGNLVEKNDNQVAIISRLDAQVNRLRLDKENLRLDQNRLHKENSDRGMTIMALEAAIREIEGQTTTN